MGICKAALEAIVEHARQAWPAECCGILIGTIDKIVEAVRAHNLSDSPNRFLIDPQDHIKARRDGRQRGLDVVGFYHSHPHSPAVPSETDCTEATYPDHLHLIVSLMAEPGDVRMFQLQSGVFRETRLVRY